MTYMQRQEELVRKLEPIYAAEVERGYRGQDLIGLASKLKRRHIEAMLADGYSQREASESAEQCADVAALNVFAGA